MNLTLNISSPSNIVTLADTDTGRYNLVQYYYKYLFCRQFTGYRKYASSPNMSSKFLSSFTEVLAEEGM